MRIAVVSTPFVAVPPKAYGGTELVVHELVEGLVQRGHDVTLYATGDSLTTATLRAFFEEPIWPPDPLADINHVTWALSDIVRGEFDLIHAHSAAVLGVARLCPKLPIVYTIHHDRNEPLSNFYSHFRDLWYVAISARQRELEIPLPRCAVIHHGLDSGRYQFRADAGDFVCFVGRFSRVKGLHTAIDAARRAGREIFVAGEVHPPDRDYFEKELKWRIDQPHVRALGCIGSSVKTPLLRDARALLAPIEWEEPFGLILIEAMLSGCPVVAFPRGSVPELVEPGLTGFIAESAAEVEEIIRPGGPIDRFDRLLCRERAAQRFGRERFVEAHEQLYARVLRETREVKVSTTQIGDVVEV